jgi:ABC-type uncharacterized transport system YnjBCD ATPase subunit
MLDVQHITVRYGNRVAISDLSLMVAGGEIVTLMGISARMGLSFLEYPSRLEPLQTLCRSRQVQHQ